MRKVLLIAGGAVLVLVAVAVAALLLLDLNQFRGPIQTQLEKSLHRKATLGRIGLSFIPLSIRVDDVAIAEDPAFDTGKPFLSVKQMYVRVGLAALLRKSVEVESARLESPTVELIKSREGKWNFATLGDSSDSGGSAFSLGRLRVNDGTVAVTDGGRTVYDRIALRIDNYAPGRKFSAEGSGHLPGKNKEEAAFKATGIAGGTDLDGSFTLTEVSMGPAVVSGEGTVTGRGNAITVKSSLKAAQADVKSPVEIESTVQYDRVSGKANVTPLAIRLEGLTMQGAAELETNATPAAYRVNLRSGGAPVADLLKAAHAFGAAQGVSGTGTASIDLRVHGKGDALGYTGTLSSPEASIVPSAGAKPVLVQSAELRLTSSEPPAGHFSAAKLVVAQTTLADVSSDLKFANGILLLEPLRARAFGGEVAGNVSVDTRGAASKTALHAKLSGVDASQLLASATAVKTLSGKVAGDVDLDLAPQPDANVARGLSGTVRLLLTDGRIAGVRLLEQLGQIARFAGDAKTGGGDFTSFSKLAGTIRIDSGVAKTDDLQLAFDGGTLNAAGVANLADETLNLDVTALLTKEMSQSVGGSKVGGYMTTAMATGKGELMIPCKVSGTFSNPRFVPDPARLAKMKLGSAGAAVSTVQSVLDQFGKSKSGEPGTERKETLGEKAKPFTDLLNSLGKKK